MNRSLCLVLAAFAAQAQDPQITGFANAASLGRYGMPNFAVAPGSRVVITGRRLGPAVEAVAAAGDPSATELAGVTISLTFGSTVLSATPLSVSAEWIVALTPDSWPRPAGTVSVSFEGRRSPPFDIQTAQSAVGLFAVNAASGVGPAQAFNVTADGELSANTLINPAVPGQTVAILGTGAGALADQMRLSVGSQELRPDRVIAAPGMPGVDRIEFKVPEKQAGCYLPVAARTGSIVSNTVTIAVTPEPGKACADPTGLGPAELAALSEGKALALGFVSVTRIVDDLTPSPLASEWFTARFSRYDAGALLRSIGVFGLPPAGTCIGWQADPGVFATEDPARGELLDAGPVLQLNGPTMTRQIERAQDGGYRVRLRRAPEADPNLLLMPGVYSLSNGDGGNDVGPFEASFRIPARVQWLNRSTAMPRGRLARIRVVWSGGEPGSFVTLLTHAENNVVAVNSVCTMPAEWGEFTTPLFFDQFIPLEGAREFGTLPGSIMLGTATQPARFTAPGLDVGYIFTNITEGFFSP